MRSAVKENSPHIDHWNSAIKVFQSMKFVNKFNGKKTVPPCIKNWIITLNSFKYLWLKLKSNGFKFFLTRHINQDPLENLFGCVRSHGIRNIQPDCYQFLCSFKTLLINNFTSIRSAGNCEHDDSEEALDNFKKFVESGFNFPNLSKFEYENKIINLPLSNPPDTIELAPISDMAIGYISGYLARTVLKEFNFCRLCKSELISNTENNPLIKARDFTKKSLMHPSDKFQRVIAQMLLLTKFILPKFNEDFIGKQLISLLDVNIEFTLTCPKHELKKFIYEKFKNFFIFTNIKNINNILKGIDRRIYTDNDHLKMSALKYFIKHQTRK